ncbi:MAG: hypothetical protein AAGF73_08870 [Actinomycetota bacterium]
MLSAVETLLQLSTLDAELTRCRIARERLPERERAATASQAVADWELESARLTARIDELTTVIDQAEARGAELTATKERLEAQMKTVIAPREAEALMHEIATIDSQHDELDLAELGALEEQSDLDDRLTAHLGQQDGLRAAAVQADEQLTMAVADIDAEVQRLEPQRSELFATLDDRIGRRYGQLLESLGSAVGQLEGSRCVTCHLDLSPGEVDVARDEAADTGFTDCPQCGRLFVV